MKKISIEKVSHYAVILIALSALFVSLWQGRVLQQHNKLTVKPYFDHSIGQTDSTLIVSISNQGFGPAIVESISFAYQGQSYDKLEDFLNGSGEIKNRRESYNFGKGEVIASGEKQIIVELSGRTIRGVKVKIVYQTVYQEKETYSFSF